MSTDASHPDDVGLCHQIMEEQQATITGLQQRMQQLEHYVEQLLRNKYGPRSERAGSASVAAVRRLGDDSGGSHPGSD